MEKKISLSSNFGLTFFSFFSLALISFDRFDERYSLVACGWCARPQFCYASERSRAVSEIK